MMSYLRFCPHEYAAIARVCRPLDLQAYLPHTLKRFLVGALAEGHAALAERIARFQPWKLQILLQHLRSRRPPVGHTTFTAAEMDTLADTFGSFAALARFGPLLKRALVRHFLAACPDLADKLHALSPEQFEALSGRVKQRLQRGP